MKKLMISMAVAVIAAFSFTDVSAKNTAKPATEVRTVQDKVEVKPEDLPEAVKATLAASPYNEWKVEKAYSVPGANDTMYFEISLSNGNDTSTVKLDKDGKVVQ